MADRAQFRGLGYGRCIEVEYVDLKPGARRYCSVKTILAVSLRTF